MSDEARSTRVPNGGSVALDELAPNAFASLSKAIVTRTKAGERLACLCAAEADDGGLWAYAVLADDAAGALEVARARLPERYPSLTPDCPQAHAFERELAEQYGVVPEGHPWLKPLRSHASFRPCPDAFGRSPGAPLGPAAGDFFRVEGEEIHEVAVGPVHAGVIEPGHFRFQCHGEHVFHLEIALGYQHRGIEKALLGGPHKLTWYQLETAAGDTTIGHGWAHALVLEALAGTAVPPRAEALRMVALELERLANHTGDLGALAGDVGFLPAASFCGRIRGDFLNLTAAICGSRLGRSLLTPGGVRFEVEPARQKELLTRLDRAASDVIGAVQLLLATPAAAARFENAGRLTGEQAVALGLVGVAARSCGLARDVRTTFRRGGWLGASLLVATADAGDVAARVMTRWLEIQSSLRLVESLLRALPTGPLQVPVAAPRAGRLALALVEGWRGEVLHLAVTGPDGRFARYKVVDPSFHNWSAVALALRDEQISDFPVINKSFNLSYCGHDL